MFASLTRYRKSCLPGLSAEYRKWPLSAFQHGAWMMLPDPSLKGVGPAAVAVICPFTTSVCRFECAMVTHTLAARAAMPKGVSLFGAAGSRAGRFGLDRPGLALVSRFSSARPPLFS